jgi:hypothetical protein
VAAWGGGGTACVAAHREEGSSGRPGISSGGASTAAASGARCAIYLAYLIAEFISGRNVREGTQDMCYAHERWNARF